MEITVEDEGQQAICCPTLPLAVYREVAAHLRQVDGVDAGLIPQQSTNFDYDNSQVGGLWIQLATEADCQLVEKILAYYGDRYGAWDVVSQSNVKRKT